MGIESGLEAKAMMVDGLLWVLTRFSCVLWFSELSFLLGGGDLDRVPPPRHSI